MSSNPSKWWEVCSNDKERSFFIGKDGSSGLIRAKSKTGEFLNWRSAEGIAKDAGLTTKEVEGIINRYHAKGIVLQSPKNMKHFGYWENVGAAVGDAPSIAERNKEQILVGSPKPLINKLPAPQPIGAANP